MSRASTPVEQMSPDLEDPPLAPEQSGLWYLQQVSPDCGAHHLLFSLEVEVDDPGLPHRAAAALTAMTLAHDVLRTALPAGAQGPVQRVRSAVRPELRVHLAEGESDDALRERARRDSREPFDLARAPLWRVHLYRRSPSCWVVVAVAHHVLLDFWSLGLLLQEFAGRLGLSESPATLPDGGAYGAHALRQQARLDDPQRTSAWLAYWRSQLDGAPPVHGLPLDAPRPAVPVHDGRSLAFALDAPTSDAVRRVARELEATPFMVMLSIYAVLLQRFSGDDDLVVATPLAGRTTRAQRHQLGQFVNTVALRLRPGAEMSFGDLVRQVRDTVVGALRHGDCPFHWLVQALAPRRDPSHLPIAQLGFAWERLPQLSGFERYFLAGVPRQAQAVPGARLTPFTVPQQEGQFELLLEMGGELDGQWVGEFKYQHHLFHRETVAVMAEAFAHLATRLTASSPGTPLSDVGLADAPATARAVALGRGPARSWPEGDLLSVIEAHARRTPRAAAVRDKARSMDHAALWARASDISAALARQGVRRGDHVGLMLTRQADLVAGVLGIWHAGAAYVPLDPDFPPQRLAQMADDARLSAVFSERALQPLWPAGLPVLCREDVPPNASPPGWRADVTGTAYLLYTSGSTGRPKGVRVGHASVRNFLFGMRDLLGWNPGTCLLAVTTPAFDISVLEMLLPLVVGGEVRIADAASTRDGRLLAQWLADPAVNAMQATPAGWRMLIDAGWEGRAGLTALCGGEPLPPGLAGQLHERTSALWNLYGPTETTVWSTAARLLPDEAIHLGAPIANTELHVLDEAGRPLPPGPLGELWIGGDGLALDYWRQPALTADRFRTVPGAGRLYRTGDRVRWTSAGRLEHHGRLDFQVKLRGFRIELGEVESALRRQPGVRDAVVVVREDLPADPRLVAYLVADGTAPPIDTLRDGLRGLLPAYMLPSAFVFLDALPQTANRKIDRKALPAPTASLPSAGDGGAPRDGVEMTLHGLYAELLGLERFGLDDDFFDLGGHSLLAVRLVAAIRQRFQIDLEIAELMQHGSVAALARRLRQQGGESRAPEDLRVVLRGGREVQPLWLFHPIGGNVVCYLELTRRLSAQRPVIAIQSPGLAQAGEAEVDIEAMARRYLALLREQQPEGPYLLGGWCFGGTVALAAARQLEADGQRIDGIVLIDTRAPVPANVPSDADDATLLSWFARDLARPHGRVLDIEPQALRELPAESMFDEVLARAKSAGVLPADADAEQLGRYVEVYLANGIALQSHFPPPSELPLLLLRARDEPPDHGPLLGWDQLASSNLQVVDVPGDHHTVMHPPNAAAVAACIDHHFPPRALPGFSA